MMAKLFVVYMLAQALHTLLEAFFSSQSVNTGWLSVGHYLKSNAHKLITQVLGSIAFFLIVVVENPDLLLNALGFIGVKNIGYGLVMILGWFIDSLGAKLLGFWGLKRPAVS
jgi:hypothetical protein